MLSGCGYVGLDLEFPAQRIVEVIKISQMDTVIVPVDVWGRIGSDLQTVLQQELKRLLLMKKDENVFSFHVLETISKGKKTPSLSTILFSNFLQTGLFTPFQNLLQLIGPIACSLRERHRFPNLFLFLNRLLL
jgi:hypothetical protein